MHGICPFSERDLFSPICFSAVIITQPIVEMQAKAGHK
jgi:hypothetical protein